jgi:hypothetical protein
LAMPARLGAIRVVDRRVMVWRAPDAANSGGNRKIHSTDKLRLYNNLR